MPSCVSTLTRPARGQKHAELNHTCINIGKKGKKIAIDSNGSVWKPRRRSKIIDAEMRRFTISECNAAHPSWFRQKKRNKNPCTLFSRICPQFAGFQSMSKLVNALWQPAWLHKDWSDFDCEAKICRMLFWVAALASWVNPNVGPDTEPWHAMLSDAVP